MSRFVFFIFLIAAFALPTVLVNAADIEDGLWMYLPLNEGAGEEVTDHGPNSFDTELSETAPKWVDAKHDDIAKALEFDGKSTHVMIDMATQGKDIDSHFDDKKGLTICAWVKPLKTGTDAHNQTRQPIVMKGGTQPVGIRTLYLRRLRRRHVRLELPRLRGLRTEYPRHRTTRRMEPSMWYL